MATTTPLLWRAFGVANTTGGRPFDPVATAIGDGRFIVVWTEPAREFDDPAPGTDLMGRIYDAGGLRLGNEFQVNSAFTANDEQNADLASRPAGGFVMVYEQTDGSGTSIRVETHDRSGAIVSGAITTIAPDVGADTLSHPVIAVRADGSYLVAYNRNADVVARIVDSSGVLGNEFLIASGSAEPDVAVLGNGNFVVSFQQKNVTPPTDNDPAFAIVSNGLVVAGPTHTDTSLNEQTTVQVAALVGGNFVVAWKEHTNSSDIGRAHLFTAEGAAVGSTFDVVAPNSITALSDGGFVVAASGGALPTLHRYDLNGVPVGSSGPLINLPITTVGFSDQATLTTLDDGRVIVSYRHIDSRPSFSQSVQAVIFDARTGPIIGTAGADSLVAPADGSGAFGLAGDDTILATLSLGSAFTATNNAAATVIDGGPGNDTLVATIGMMTGGPGNDRFYVRFPSDSAPRIQDFTPGQDLILLNHTDLGINGAGSLAAAGVAFNVGSTPRNDTEILQYDPTSYAITWLKTGSTLAIIDPGHTVAWGGSPDLGTRLPPYQVAGIGDFNGDGTDDIVWRDPGTGKLDEWRMANSQWAGSIDLGNHGPDWQIAGIGDFNHDGTDDVLWRNSTTGQLDEWVLANGNWSRSIDLGNHGVGWQVAGIGDFNHDGTDDVLFRESSTGHLDLWIMFNGNWSRSGDLGSHGADWQVAGVGDLTGDGTADVLFRNGAGQLDEWAIQNGQWKASRDLGSHGADWQVAAIADFNSNGTADVLWRQPATGAMDAWVIGGGQWIGSAPFGPFDSAYTIPGVGDFNHDGIADVLWRNPATGQTSEWTIVSPTPSHASDYLIV